MGGLTIRDSYDLGERAKGTLGEGRGLGGHGVSKEEDRVSASPELELEREACESKCRSCQEAVPEGALGLSPSPAITPVGQGTGLHL